jgi:hypothetical protein
MIKRILGYWAKKLECWLTEHDGKDVFGGCTRCGRSGLD